MNALDKGTCGIYYFYIFGFKGICHRFGYAVGTDNNGLPFRSFFRTYNHTNTHLFELGNCMAVVDNWAQGQHLLSGCSLLLNGFHSAADTEAEAGALCKCYAHNGIFFPAIALISATT